MAEVQRRRQPRWLLGGLRGFAQHQKNAAHHTVQAFACLIPKEAREHGRAAAREWLCSFRALIDEAAGALGADAASEGRTQPPAQKVKVKVED